MLCIVLHLLFYSCFLSHSVFDSFSLLQYSTICLSLFALFTWFSPSTHCPFLYALFPPWIYIYIIYLLCSISVCYALCCSLTASSFSCYVLCHYVAYCFHVLFLLMLCCISFLTLSLCFLHYILFILLCFLCCLLLYLCYVQSHAELFSCYAMLSLAILLSLLFLYNILPLFLCSLNFFRLFSKHYAFMNVPRFFASTAEFFIHPFKLFPCTIPFFVCIVYYVSLSSSHGCKE